MGIKEQSVDRFRIKLPEASILTTKALNHKQEAARLVRLARTELRAYYMEDCNATLDQVPFMDDMYYFCVVN